MKIKIDSDEWYPVYSVRSVEDYGGHEVEVTEDQVARWESAFAAFEAAQEEMSAIYVDAENVAREKAAAEKAERDAKEKADREQKQREIEEANLARRRAVERLTGTVYDASGNPVGEVSEGSMGLTVKPLIP
jgi:membrane protein involved in colicin uptake